MTWDRIQEIAYGQLKWKPQDFKVFSLREFVNAWRGHDLDMQQHWAMARQVGYYIVSMQQDKKGRIKKPQDLFKLGFEKQQEGPIKYAKIRKINGND